MKVDYRVAKHIAMSCYLICPILLLDIISNYTSFDLKTSSNWKKSENSARSLSRNKANKASESIMSSSTPLESLPIRFVKLVLTFSKWELLFCRWALLFSISSTLPTGRPSMPHGTMLLKGDRSVVTLSASPW